MKQTLRKKLDKLWSNTIRTRDGRCLRHIGKNRSSILNAHHVILKARGDILRWDVLNGISLCCMPCHKWHKGSAHDNNDEFNEWFRTRYPDRWEYLQKQKSKITHFKDHHYEKIAFAIETLTPILMIEDYL